MENFHDFAGTMENFHGLGHSMENFHDFSAFLIDFYKKIIPPWKKFSTPKRIKRKKDDAPAGNFKTSNGFRRLSGDRKPHRPVRVNHR
jgi:hypothetical protein